MIQIMFQDGGAETLGRGGSWAECLDLAGSAYLEGTVNCEGEGMMPLPVAVEEEYHDEK
jgi:hypothetical protein